MPPVVACDDLAAVTAPILFVRGELSPQQNAQLRACLPAPETVTIRDASHGVHADNPIDFNESVLNFISDH
jgi:pimeloyl-ACP methyl ester carboxylesterase